MPDVRVRDHEVWFNPGWDDQQRVYRGDDPVAAAHAYAQAVLRITKDPDQVVWTVDGLTHQQLRGVVV